MASLFTHALVGTALGQASYRDRQKDWRFWAVVVSCSILADLDSIGFHAGVPYGSLWGHRGMTHSLLFAAVIATCLSLVFRRIFPPLWKLGILLFAILVSHGILDAMTNGGLGVAFFSPFDTDRYFFSWRPIQVSPLGVRRFFTHRGLAILSSEMLWIWFPVLAFAVVMRAIQSLWTQGHSPLEDDASRPEGDRGK
jgi:inner membrane protein